LSALENTLFGAKCPTISYISRAVADFVLQIQRFCYCRPKSGSEEKLKDAVKLVDPVNYGFDARICNITITPAEL